MTHDHDSRDDASISKVTRRGVMAAVGLGGLAALGGGSASGQTVGGDDADELADHLTRVYEGDEADLPSAGVAGRRFIVLDAGGSYDPGTILRDDGSSWSPINLGVESLNTGEGIIGKTKHLSEGSDLGQLISDAVSNGYSTFYIHAHEDGSAWSWDADYVHNLQDDGPLRIACGPEVEVEYGGNGRPLWVEGIGTGSFRRDGGAFQLWGGEWTYSGSPDQWLRVDDGIGVQIHPDRVSYQGSGATCLEMRSVESWNELGVISGTYIGGNGIDFVPTVETGPGNGTDSFQGTTIKDVRINHYNDDGFGIRLSGNFQYSELRRPNIFPNGVGSAAMRLNTIGAGAGMLGTTIQNLQAEGGGAISSGDAYAIDTTDNYDGFYAGFFIQPKIGGNVTTVLDPTASDDRVPALQYGGNNIEIGNWATDTWASIDVSSGNFSANAVTSSGRIKAGDGFEATEFNGKVRFNGGGGHGLVAGGNPIILLDDSGISQNRYNPTDQSGNTGSNTGEVRLDDGTNTTHGDPDLVIWTGSDWRQVGTTNTFT